ncbi:ParB-like protein partition protein [Candidatus Roizmanbacteria bacterium]|nr:ParB-like protein partition protein [Candidatus Roizmanbacteria bacterium]
MVQDITSLINQIKSENDIFQKYRRIDYLIREKKLRIIDLASKIGYKSSYICHLLRLKKIPDVVIDGYYSKSISSSHIYVLSRLSDSKQMINLYEKILVENYTVKQTESAVREVLYQVKSIGKYINKENTEKLTEKIKEKYPELNIQIIQTRIKGKVILEVKGDLEKSTKVIKSILELIK